MARKYTRKLKGGDVNIEAVKPTIIQLQDDVVKISNDVEELGRNLGIMNENIPEPEVVTPEPEVVTPEPEVVTPEPEVVTPEPVEQPIQGIRQQTINITDFSKGITNQITVENLLQNIQNKIKQLPKNTGNKYSDFSNKINAAIKNNDINEIQKIWDTKVLTFKNDKIMGGKTKKLQKNQKKSKKHNKTKK
jgi:hypothetical protein